MDAPETSNASTNQAQRKNSQKLNKQGRDNPPRTHSFNKRPISKPSQRKCDIYVSNKSNFQVIYRKKNESVCLIVNRAYLNVFLHEIVARLK